MAEKMKHETVEDLVQAAHRQTAYLIETMIRQAVADFESSNSDGFKLVLTIEAERKGTDATLTLQSNGVSGVNIKRKDQTPAIVIDYGPTLFDPPATGTSDIGSEADMPGEVIDMEEVGKPVRLLPGGRKAIRGRKAKALPAHTDAADKEEGGAQ